MARKVVLAGACRTAIGVMGGQFANTSAVELGTIVIKEALKRAGVSPDQVDEVYMGNVIQAGNGQNPARQAAVHAGIPNEVPATTINVLCGSGLHCVNLAAKLIAAGDADIIVTGMVSFFISIMVFIGLPIIPIRKAYKEQMMDVETVE